MVYCLERKISLSKIFEGKAYGRCLRVCLLTGTALHFMLLRGNDHSRENEEKQIFELMQTFDNNKDVLEFVEDGNIFEDDEQ